MELSEEEWKKRLTKEEYRILREKETEAPFSGKYYDNKKKGIYRCAGCGRELFKTEDQYDAGCGWPSFTKPTEGDAVAYESDHKLDYERTEVHCQNCKGHLGHVFNDGPAPTRARYCINSAALKFEDKP